MLSHANEILQIVTATLLGLVCILFATHSKSGQHIWVGIGFTLSIFCYVIIESRMIQSSIALVHIFMIGAICTPVLFWLLAQAIFEDHFKLSRSVIGWFLLQIVPHIFICAMFAPTWIAQFSKIIAGFVSFGFVLAGLYTALRTKQGDLVDSRLKFRNVFIIVTATLIGVTIIVEAVPIDKEAIVILQVLQRVSIFGITLYFIVNNFGLRSGFFFNEIAKPKTPTQDDPQLNSKLQALIEGQKVYRKEGLTIGELAEQMSEQEYRLRRLINGQLGFRNFNDFLNQYRINEACEILSDPGQTKKTILEIAYDLGYQSIGPFNKAFKDLKGMTPTAYRKNQVSE